MKGSRWTAAELEMLAHMVENQPIDRYPHTYNKWARLNGYPERTKATIQQMVGKHRMTDKSCGEWVSAGYIQQALGISLGRVSRLSDVYGIPCHRTTRGRRFFRRSDLRKAARDRPEIFAGIGAAELFVLLEDAALSESISSKRFRRRCDPWPVRIIENGWEYPSVTAGAKHFGVRRVEIQRSIRTGGTAAGYHWTHV